MRAQIVALGIGIVLLCGCEQKPAVVLHDLMKDVVAPQAQIAWDLANNAQDDDGKPDSSKLADGDWAKIAEAGQKLRDAALSLTQAGRITVAAPGQKIQDEENAGASTVAQVQGFINADMPAFAAFATPLAANADQFVSASKSHDAAKLAEASGSLDQVCESCHVKTWYRQQSGAK